MSPDPRDAFLSKLKKLLPDNTVQDLEDGFPDSWTVEYKFADFPKDGKYVIPFFSRVTFDETKREIEAMGYQPVAISFIRLSNFMGKK